jgi:hypothetical protein
MAQTTIDRLIINSPYAGPACYWHYGRETRTFPFVTDALRSFAARLPHGMERVSGCTARTADGSETC